MTTLTPTVGIVIEILVLLKWVEWLNLLLNERRLHCERNEWLRRLGYYFSLCIIPAHFSTQIAPVANIPEGEIQVPAVKTDPISHTFCQWLLIHFLDLGYWGELALLLFL